MRSLRFSLFEQISDRRLCIANERRSLICTQSKTILAKPKIGLPRLNQYWLMLSCQALSGPVAAHILGDDSSSFSAIPDPRSREYDVPLLIFPILMSIPQLKGIGKHLEKVMLWHRHEDFLSHCTYLSDAVLHSFRYYYC